MVLLQHYPIEIFPFGWLLYPLKPLKHINILRTLPLLSVFQESSSITKVTEEIFEVKSTYATATTSQPIRTKPFTATLNKCRGLTPNTKSPNYPKNYLQQLLHLFHLSHQHRSNCLKKHTCLHSLVPPYFGEWLRSY